MASSAANGGAVAWSNPDNAKVSDNARAVAASIAEETTSQYLHGSNFGFAIPVGATIDGVKIEVEGRVTVGAASSNFVNLILAGNLVDDYEISIPGLDGTDTYYATGGPTELWGATLTPAIVNASNFGVAVFFYNGFPTASTIEIDHIRVTVYYTGGAVAGSSAGFFATE